MEDIILIVIIALIVGLAGFYIWKQKKKGCHLRDSPSFK